MTEENNKQVDIIDETNLKSVALVSANLVPPGENGQAFAKSVGGRLYRLEHGETVEVVAVMIGREQLRLEQGQTWEEVLSKGKDIPGGFVTVIAKNLGQTPARLFVSAKMLLEEAPSVTNGASPGSPFAASTVVTAPVSGGSNASPRIVTVGKRTGMSRNANGAVSTVKVSKRHVHLRNVQPPESAKRINVRRQGGSADPSRTHSVVQGESAKEAFERAATQGLDGERTQILVRDDEKYLLLSTGLAQFVLQNIRNGRQSPIPRGLLPALRSSLNATRSRVGTVNIAVSGVGVILHATLFEILDRYLSGRLATLGSEEKTALILCFQTGMGIVPEPEATVPSNIKTPLLETGS